MSKPQSADSSSEEEVEDDPTRSPHKPVVPMQKRRRVTRACDECRRKKIKCDGKQPCTHCTVYSYECTYDQPSNRRRNPAPQYVEALEIRLQRAESILRDVLPEVNLDDPSWDASVQRKLHPLVKQESIPGLPAQGEPWVQEGTPQQGSYGEKDSMLESMVEDTGSLDLDDDGHWDFHGHSSGRAFLRKMREQFGDLMGNPDAFNASHIKSRLGPQSTSSPASSLHSPMGSQMPHTGQLPAKRCATQFCANALDDACAVLRFVHQPTFYAMFHRVYDTPSPDFGSQELKFLPLLYSVIALGTLFATAEQSELMTNGFENAIEQGYHWYKTSRSMIDVTDCRDLTSLQTVLFMILFLQSSGRLSACYSHIGIVLRSSIRMGLHRAVSITFNPIEQETRKRIFWCVRKLDAYVGALLGLPKALSDDDVDQDQPAEVDDEYITVDEIKPMPSGRPSFMTAFNAHTRMLAILSKTVRYIYPIKSNTNSKNHSYIVSHAKIREIEHDLQQWMENLPEPFRPGGKAPPEFVRLQHFLRMAYAHIEMFLYRPFLHYVSQDVQAKSFDKRSFACAAACISVSRNIIHITGEMKISGLLVGSYWFYMYTTFFAVISLVFFVLENPNSAASADILRDALEGRDTLAGLAARSLAADRCSKQLADLFEQLPEKLGAARMYISSQKKRQAPFQPQAMQSASEVRMQAALMENSSRRATTLPSGQVSGQSPPMPTSQLNPSVESSFGRDPLNSDSSATRQLQTSQNLDSAIFSERSRQHGVPDVSAMMFPSANPFAYPTQPMTTLESSHYIKHESPTIQPNARLITNAEYDNINAHMLGSTASYNMGPCQQQISFLPQSMNMSGEAPLVSDMTMQTEAGTWSQQQQVQGVPHGMRYDQLFGEDWGGWMNKGYKQQQ